MNLAAFEAAVAAELGLNSSDSTEKTLIDDAINRGVERVLEDTHCYVVRTDFSTFDGSTDDWDMTAAGILEAVEMYLTSGGTRYALERVSSEELVEHRRSGVPSGSPTTLYAVQGANLIMFWPTPGSGDTLSVYNVPTPTPLASGGDDPADAAFAGIPSALHRAIFLYACSELASYDDDQTSAQGQRYLDWYDKEIVRYQKLMRKRGGSRNARAVVNAKRVPRQFHRNDIYP